MGLNVNCYLLIKLFLFVFDCMSNIWYNQSVYPKQRILLSFEQRLNDQFKPKWCADLNVKSKRLCNNKKK